MSNKQLQPIAKRLPPSAGRGRQKGELNKFTRTVKEAILAAFDEVGGHEWLVQQAKDNPVAFMGLLAKILPTQIDLKTKGEPIKIIVERADPIPATIIEADDARNPAALN